jgi:hypothetical protein
MLQRPAVDVAKNRAEAVVEAAVNFIPKFNYIVDVKGIFLK